YAWGGGGSGQLGNNAASNMSSPVSVAGGRSYSQLVTAAATNSMWAIEASTGNAYAWGLGGSGELGNNAASNMSSPVSVAGGRSYSKIIPDAGGTAVIAIEASTGNA